MSVSVDPLHQCLFYFKLLIKLSLCLNIFTKLMPSYPIDKILPMLEGKNSKL